MAEAVRFAEEQGYRLVEGRKHYHLEREGYPRLDVPRTSSDWRAPLNLKAQVRRAQPWPDRQESA